MSDEKSEGKKADCKLGATKNQPTEAEGRQQEDGWQREAEIERMIEAKVSQAHRLMH